MEILAKCIVAWRKAIVVLFALATLIALVLLPHVVINYDQTAYLPEDMPTRLALGVMEREFGLYGSAEVLVPNLDVPAAVSVKQAITAISGVRSVLWLDDLVDISLPLSLLPQESLRAHFVDGVARFQVTLAEGDHALSTGRAVQDLRRINGGNAIVRGPAVDALNLRQTATDEIATIVILVAPVFLGILVLATSSWLEPLLFILTIGISILLNMGTNALLGPISFITHTTAGLLQFAVTMDYSIFLLHRFSEERSKGLGVERAMVVALKHSFAPILASSLTTIAGFVALMFMRYGLGIDLGLVLAKGVALSLISVVTLLPALVIFSARLIERTHHRALLPAWGGWARAVVNRRFVIPVVLLVLPVAFIAQGANHFLYGEGAPADPRDFHPQFGWHNPAVLLVPNGDLPREAALAETLSKLTHVHRVQSLATLVDAGVPRAMIPAAVREEFTGPQYTRLVLMLNTAIESPPAFSTVAAIRDVAENYYPGTFWLLGSSPAVDDIRAVVEYDFSVISLVAILAVGGIIALTYRSLALPLLLVLTIQASIWLNMAIPYFTGAPLIFIGYMIVSAVQLGATIDYAILLSSRYLEFRRSQTPPNAALAAAQSAGPSVLTSAAIMAAAGFTLGFVSGVPSIAALGMLIGRGALLSCLLVLTFLPQLLMVSDRFIQATTYQHRFLNERRGPV